MGSNTDAATEERRKTAARLRKRLVANWELQEAGSDEEAEFADLLRDADALCAALEVAK